VIEVPLHSLLGLDLSLLGPDLSLLGLSFRAIPRVLLAFRLKILNVVDLYFILCYGIVVCHFLIQVFSWIIVMSIVSRTLFLILFRVTFL